MKVVLMLLVISLNQQSLFFLLFLTLTRMGMAKKMCTSPTERGGEKLFQQLREKQQRGGVRLREKETVLNLSNHTRTYTQRAGTSKQLSAFTV